MGRVTLPIELRRLYGMMIDDLVDIVGDDEKGGVVIRPYSLQCGFCGSKDDLHECKKMLICGGCIREIKRIGGGK